MKIQWQSASLYASQEILRSKCGRFQLTERTEGWSLLDRQEQTVTCARFQTTLKSIASYRVGDLSIMKTEPRRENL